MQHLHKSKHYRLFNMESPKASNLDEKTGKLIEEMEKSLRNMEKSLGMDHPVVAKILDSYASLLKQNNIRHLDALNMEARARAIRAKHNQLEAEKQTQDIASLGQERRMSTAQIKLLSRAISICVLIAFTFGGFQVVGWFSNHSKKSAQLRGKDGKILSSKLPEMEKISLVSEAAGKTKSQESVQENSAGAEQFPEGEFSGSDDGPPLKEQDDSVEKQRLAARVQSLSVFELAEKMLKLKKLATRNLDIGLEAEKAKDFPKASSAYFEVISQVQHAPEDIGRPVVSEDIARCYEGYGRMAELDSKPELSQKCEEAAKWVRAQL